MYSYFHTVLYQSSHTNWYFLLEIFSEKLRTFRKQIWIMERYTLGKCPWVLSIHILASSSQPVYLRAEVCPDQTLLSLLEVSQSAFLRVILTYHAHHIFFQTSEIITSLYNSVKFTIVVNRVFQNAPLMVLDVASWPKTNYVNSIP